MSNAQDSYGTVFKEGAAILLARIVGSNGQAIARNDVSAVEYSVFELDDCRPNAAVPVAGHDAASLAVGTTVFDALQNDSLWTVDSTGYNFRHEVDVSTNEAFPQAGVSYQVRYELTPMTGQKVVFRFHLRAI